MRGIAFHYLQHGPGIAGSLLDRATSADFGAWKCDLADDRLTWTGAVYDLFGIARGETIDRRDAVEMYDPASRAALARLRTHAIATGCGFSLDARIHAADGATRWMRISTEVVQLGGRSVALHGVKRDITASMARWGTVRA